MQAASLPASVYREWFGDAPPLSVEQVSGGFSGARVYRCEGSRGCVALRQWTADTRRERMEEIHGVMRTAYSKGCPAVPQLLLTRHGTSFLSIGSRYWDCSTWKPGQAWEEENSAVSRVEAIRAGCQTVASFHHSVADLASLRGPPQSVHVRWRRLHEVEDWLSAPLQYQNGGIDFRPATDGALPLTWLARVERQVKAIWRREGGRLRERLKWFSQQTFPLQYVLRDVHRDHVLFETRRVSGLIDFDAVRIDSPAADIARFVSSFFDIPQRQLRLGAIGNAAESPCKPPFPALWEAAMAGYRAERPFSDQEFQLANFLAEIGPLLSLANWAIWSTTQPRSFPSPPNAIAARAEHLSRCLQTIFDIG